MAKIKTEIIEKATKNLRIILTLSTHILSNIYFSRFTLVHATFVLGLQLYSVYYFRNSTEEVAQVIFYIGVNLAVMIGCYTGTSPYYLNRLIVDDSYFSYDYQSSVMAKKLDEVKGKSARILKTFFKTILILLIWVSSNLAGLTILVGLIKQQPIYLFPIWHPFDMNNIIVQILVLMWEQYVMFTIIFMSFGGGSILFVPYAYIKAEVELLKYALKEIEPRTQEMARKRYILSNHLDKDRVLSACYIKCINMCVEHHLDLLKYINIAKRIVGLSYTVGFCSGIIACTFSGYNINSENLELKFKNLGIILFILGYLFVMFWIGTETTSDLLSIADTLYTMEWYNLPKECQSTLKILLLMSNQPVFYRMPLGQKVDMEAYMALVKGTYYYLNILTA